MHAVTVVADDLTGTMDASQGFASQGYSTAVVADVEDGIGAVDTAVLGVNTDSRYDETTDAVNSVSTAIAAAPARTVYKKVDSTLRGNVAAEVDAALAATDAELALVVPAFPSAGRTTRDGIHYVNGKPVVETEYADNENGPPSSSVPGLFRSVNRPTELVPHTAIEDAADRIAEITDRYDRAPVVVCDVLEDDHLATLARATENVDALYVGSAGLARYVSVHGADRGERFPTYPSVGGALCVAGSVSATTLEQVAQVPDEVLVTLDGPAILTDENSNTVVERSVRRLRAGRPVVVTAAPNDAAVERTLAAGREQGIDPSETRDRVARALASAGADILHEEAPSGLLLTGGDIAVAVIRTLDARTIRLTGNEIEAGIPLGSFADGGLAGTPVITKAGGFGTRETIVNSLDILTGGDE